MQGKNLIRLPDGKRRCRACQLATQKRLRREDTLRRKAGFSERIDGLSMEQLLQRRPQAKIMVDTAEKALDLARKEDQRRKVQKDKSERKVQQSLEIYHAAVQQLEEIDRVYKDKADAEGTF